jgi:hypothetical protein
LHRFFFIFDFHLCVVNLFKTKTAPAVNSLSVNLAEEVNTMVQAAVKELS